MNREAGVDVSAFRAALVNLARDYGVELDPATVDRFETHYELLCRWNRKINLTRITAPEEAARRHFLESAYLTTLVDRPTRLVDVGSGAGFPGLPLACLWPETATVLVEPLAKRATFLKEAIRGMDLPDVTVEARHFDDALVPAGALLVARALDGFDALLPALMGSPAGSIALFSEPELLARAATLRPPGRNFALPQSENRMIGIFS